MSKTGNALSVVVDTTSIEIFGGGIRVASGVAGTGLSGGSGIPLSVNASQPQITSVGTLSSLTVTGPVVFSGSVSGILNRAFIRDEKSIGTNGGTFTSGGWITRTLNVANLDAYCGTSLNSNQVTLVAGSYVVEGQATALNVFMHVAIFYCVTDSTIAITGTTQRSGNENVSSVSTLKNKLVLTTTKVYELRHRCTTTQTDTGFGQASGFSSEIYATLFITKV